MQSSGIPLLLPRRRSAINGESSGSGVGMLTPRTGYWSLVAVGVLLLPACATTSRGVKPAEEVAPPAVAASPTRETGFAVLPAAPGQRVARNPPAEPTPAAAPAAVVKPADPVVPKPEVTPPPPDAPLVAAVKALLDNRPEAAVEHLKALDRPNQDLVAQLLPPVVTLSRANLGRAGPVEFGALAGQLETPFDALAAKSDLRIPKAELCSSPVGFGKYRPLPAGHVYKGGTLADVYVEVRNVPSVATWHPDYGEGFVTHLATALRLRDAAGNVVELTDEDRRPVSVLRSVQKEFSRSPVRDYAKAFRFEVPRKPGRYTLTVEFQDPANGRVASRGMSFDVGGS